MIAKKPPYRPNLDLLRLLAALWVMGTHYAFVGPLRYGFDLAPSADWVTAFFRHGYLGITLFFVISGYVITLTSVRSGAVDYARRRIVRVFPAFWICVSLSALIFWLLGWQDQQLFQRWAANLVLLPQLFGQPFMDGVYWTLVYECIFYTWVFVLLALGIYHRWLEVVCLCWIVIALVNQLWLQSGMLEKLFLTVHAGSFVTGMLLCRISMNGWRPDRAFLLALAAITISVGLAPLSIYEFPGGIVGPASLHANLISSVGCVLLIVLAIWIRPLASKRLAIAAGGLTYPVYLLHQEIGFAVFNAAAVDTYWAVLAVSLSVILASHAVYRLETKIRPWFCDVLQAAGKIPASSTNRFRRMQRGEIIK